MLAAMSSSKPASPTIAAQQADLRARLPFSELKIDKGFVLAMVGDDRNTAIVRSVIELGHSLGFTVTAEGVETLDALRRLIALGCDTVQGYLLARPGPSTELTARITAATAVASCARAATAPCGRCRSGREPASDLS